MSDLKPPLMKPRVWVVPGYLARMWRGQGGPPALESSESRGRGDEVVGPVYSQPVCGHTAGGQDGERARYQGEEAGGRGRQSGGLQGQGGPRGEHSFLVRHHRQGLPADE